MSDTSSVDRESLLYLETLQQEQDEYAKLQEEASKREYEIDVVIADDRFAKMYNQEQFSDAIFHLVNSDTYIYVTKAIIAAQSGLLQNLFVLDTVMNSEQTGRYQIVDIDEYESAFEAMIRYMYTGRLQCMFDDLFPLLMLTRQYRVDKLNTETMKYLSGMIDEDNCLNVYMFCVNQYTDETEQEELDVKLRKKCLSFIVRRFEYVSKSDYFLQECTEDFLEGFLKMESLQVRDEGVVLEAIVNWVKYALLDRLPYVPELMELVRLEHVPVDTIELVLKENEWLTVDEDFNRRVNFVLFQKYFQLSGQTPPELGYENSNEEKPAILESYKHRPVRVVSKDRGVIQISRGEIDMNSGWIQTARKIDAIDVTAKNKCMHLVGIGVNSGMKPSPYTANIQITQGLKTLLIRTFSWNGKDLDCQRGYKALTFFDKPIFLQPGETISIGVLIKGPYTTQTRNGKEKVIVEYDCDNIEVTFSNSARDENNTSVQKGQIPCIFIQ